MVQWIPHYSWLHAGEFQYIRLRWHLMSGIVRGYEYYDEDDIESSKTYLSGNGNIIDIIT